MSETSGLSAEDAVRALLASMGIDPHSSRMAETPRRVVETFRELLAGVGRDERLPLAKGDPVPHGMDLVALRSLEFRSMCAHHLMPFSGVVHVAYLPVERLVGIGSIVRTLEILSTRPQLQENLAQELADAVCEGAGAAGALVVVEARHSCIADRGPREAASSLVVVAASGTLTDPQARSEALRTIQTPIAPE